MGRRSGVPLGGADFTGSLAHDPILGSPGGLTSPGSLHGAAGPGWWLPPHAHHHGLSPDFFQPHTMSSGWLGHEHELGHEDCTGLYPTSRTGRGSLMNGVSSASAFASGSGIFYPSASNPQSRHGYGLQGVPPGTTKGNPWVNNMASHGMRGSSDQHEMDMMSPSRHKSNSMSDENNGDLNADVRIDSMGGKDERKNVRDNTRDVPEDMEKDLVRLNETQSKHQQPSQSEGGQQKSLLSTRKKPPDMGNSRFSPPSKPSKTKAPPPPRLNVPKSILNSREGIVPKKPENLQNLHTSSLPSGETLKHLQNSIRTKQASLTTRGGHASEKYDAEKAYSSGPKSTDAGEKQKQPSGRGAKPRQSESLLVARFRGATYNAESSDEESNSSEVSSGTDSGSGSESEGAEELEGGEEVSSASESGSGGSEDEDEDAAELEDEDDDDEFNLTISGHGSEGDTDRSLSGTPLGKRKTDSGGAGELMVLWQFPDSDSGFWYLSCTGMPSWIHACKMNPCFQFLYFQFGFIVNCVWYSKSAMMYSMLIGSGAGGQGPDGMVWDHAYLSCRYLKTRGFLHYKPVRCNSKPRKTCYRFIQFYYCTHFLSYIIEGKMRLL